ncbi:hypothetical protein ACI3PL_20900, partial [Lacticaseibacillus paracasei]
EEIQAAKPPAATAAATTAAASTKAASVPLMVTKEMNQALADLGYTEQDRASLRPEEAQSIIAENLRKPSDLRAASVAPMQTVDTTAVDAAKS